MNLEELTPQTFDHATLRLQALALVGYHHEVNHGPALKKADELVAWALGPYPTPKIEPKVTEPGTLERDQFGNEYIRGGSDEAK